MTGPGGRPAASPGASPEELAAVLAALRLLPVPGTDGRDGRSSVVPEALADWRRRRLRALGQARRRGPAP